jgi:hypothetical protein
VLGTALLVVCAAERDVSAFRMDDGNRVIRGRSYMAHSLGQAVDFYRRPSTRSVNPSAP